MGGTSSAGEQTLRSLGPMAEEETLSAAAPDCRSLGPVTEGSSSVMPLMSLPGEALVWGHRPALRLCPYSCLCLRLCPLLWGRLYGARASMVGQLG